MEGASIHKGVASIATSGGRECSTEKATQNTEICCLNTDKPSANLEAMMLYLNTWQLYQSGYDKYKINSRYTGHT